MQQCARQSVRCPEVHDDVTKWKNFPRYWPFARGISNDKEMHLYREAVISSVHKGQWREALVFSLICDWINGWVNNREAGDLRRHRAHYEVTVMLSKDWYYIATSWNWVTGNISTRTVWFFSDGFLSANIYGIWYAFKYFSSAHHSVLSSLFVCVTLLQMVMKNICMV